MAKRDRQPPPSAPAASPESDAWKNAPDEPFASDAPAYPEATIEVRDLSGDTGAEPHTVAPTEAITTHLAERREDAPEVQAWERAAAKIEQPAEAASTASDDQAPPAADAPSAQEIQAELVRDIRHARCMKKVRLPGVKAAAYARGETVTVRCEFCRQNFHNEDFRPAKPATEG